jgi:hypothetical protein
MLSDDSPIPHVESPPSFIAWGSLPINVVLEGCDPASNRETNPIQKRY